MILSLLRLDVGSPSVRQSLRDCQDMHRSLMKAFDTDRVSAGMLYRVNETRSAIQVIVLSREMPAWERIEAKGYHCLQTRDLSALTVMYREHAVLRFQLAACPSKKVAGNGKNSTRVFLKTAQERAAWLERQGEKYGFRLLEAHENGAQIKVTGNRKDAEMVMTAVPFEGVLEITDADAFWNAYQSGFGPEKAYGMGLMLLMKV